MRLARRHSIHGMRSQAPHSTRQPPPATPPSNSTTPSMQIKHLRDSSVHHMCYTPKQAIHTHTHTHTHTHFTTCNLQLIHTLQMMHASTDLQCNVVRISRRQVHAMNGRWNTVIVENRHCPLLLCLLHPNHPTCMALVHTHTHTHTHAHTHTHTNAHTQNLCVVGRYPALTTHVGLHTHSAKPCQTMPA